MNNRKTVNLLMSFILIASLLFGGSAPVNAESEASPNAISQNKDKDKNKITHKDRQDAAAKAYQRGALNPLMIQIPGMDGYLINGTVSGGNIKINQ